VLRVRTIWASPTGGPYFTNHYFLVGSDGDAVTAQAAATAVGDFWESIDATINLAVAWSVQVNVDLLDSTNGALLDTFAVIAASGAGDSTGDMLPSAAQGLVRWATDAVIDGRRVRGRTFIPGVSEAFAAAGVPAPTFLSTALTAATTLAGQDLSVWHRPTGDPPSGGAAVPVTGAAVWNQFAVLTSRRD